MSAQYDRYLVEHKENVKKGYDWLWEHLPNYAACCGEWNTHFAHDASKSEPDEYEAYDAYFYGGNRSFEVVRNFNKAWLKHIHRNPHHWQHWVLINDDPKEGEIILDMPMEYIIEMICDWWSFSWKTGNLFEIFNWYEERKDYIKLSKRTRNIVENIMMNMHYILSGNDGVITHHGIKGQKWGVKNGPPYPIQNNGDVEKVGKHDNIVDEAIRSGEVSKTINKEKQMRHTKSEHLPGRSYLDGDLDYAQKLVDEHCGKGEAIIDKNGNWTRKEKFTDSDDIGTHVDPNSGMETKTNSGMITYSKTGTHVYPRKEN